MRMRGIEDGYKEIKEKDPDTALTKTALRRLITTGEIPSVRIGTKYIFNLDTVEQYLSCVPKINSEGVVTEKMGFVRRVEV